MNWLLRDAFWKHWRDDDPSVQIDYCGWCYFKIAEAELRSRIGEMEPNQDLRGEDDPPCPVSRWYGDLDGIPVLLDFRAHPYGDVVLLHHGSAAGARERVRQYFYEWGRAWQESPSLQTFTSGS